jgi:hypothetical protein
MRMRALWEGDGWFSWPPVHALRMGRGRALQAMWADFIPGVLGHLVSGDTRRVLNARKGKVRSGGGGGQVAA